MNNFEQRSNVNHKRDFLISCVARRCVSFRFSFENPVDAVSLRILHSDKIKVACVVVYFDSSSVVAFERKLLLFAWYTNKRLPVQRILFLTKVQNSTWKFWFTNWTNWTCVARRTTTDDEFESGDYTWISKSNYSTWWSKWWKGSNEVAARFKVTLKCYLI